MWILSALVAASLVQSPAAPAPPQAPVSTEALGQAYMLFLEARQIEDSDIDGAIAKYRRAVELAPNAPDVHAELALLLARKGNADESFREAAAAIAIDPDNHAARRVRGLVKADMVARASDAGLDRSRATSMAHEAIEDLERVAADRLVDPIVGLTLGRLYVQTSQHEKAVERLSIFLLDRPGYPDAVLLLAEAYEGLRDFPAAIEALESVAPERTELARLLTRLATLRERVGRWREAADAWGQLAARHPTAPMYRTRQATALVNGGNLAAGREIAAALTAERPRDVGAWYLLAQIERRLGNFARAEEAASEIIAIDADDPRGPLSLAAARAARKDYKGVVDALAARVRAPLAQDLAGGTFAQMANELAMAYGEMGDHKRAIAALEDARRRDDRHVGLLFSLGAAYERGKRYDEAERTFRQVIAADPDHADALNYLGYMFAERRVKLDEAVELITRALAIEADNPSYLDSLGWAYVQQARLDAARDPLQRAAAALPKISVIQDHLAELYFRLKLYDEAVATWDRALTGDREGVDVDEITRKRNRAKGLSERK